jgi:pimeloyl-ACP methyl ester carboxylesterase
MPYTFSPGWPEANGDRYEEILDATLEYPTAAATIDTHIDASYGFFERALEIERITAPALVIHGRDDVIVPPENGRMLARRLPDARLVELEHRGHNLQLEDPETFNALVLEFLG